MDLAEAPDWYRGSDYETKRLLTPGAAFAWDYALELVESDLDLYEDGWSGSFIWGFLPDRFRDQYDNVFLEHMLVDLRHVHGLVKSPPSIPLALATPAQEIALFVLEQAAVTAAEIDLDTGTFSLTAEDMDSAAELREFLAEDPDVELLYGFSWDGVE